jgi:hypothetical protein
MSTEHKLNGDGNKCLASRSSIEDDGELVTESKVHIFTCKCNIDACFSIMNVIPKVQIMPLLFQNLKN